MELSKGQIDSLSAAAHEVWWAVYILKLRGLPKIYVKALCRTSGLCLQVTHDAIKELEAAQIISRPKGPFRAVKGEINLLVTPKRRRTA